MYYMYMYVHIYMYMCLYYVALSFMHNDTQKEGLGDQDPEFASWLPPDSESYVHVVIVNDDCTLYMYIVIIINGCIIQL